jgi:hypothetical protein
VVLRLSWPASSWIAFGGAAHREVRAEGVTELVQAAHDAQARAPLDGLQPDAKHVAGDGAAVVERWHVLAA